MINNIKYKPKNIPTILEYQGIMNKSGGGKKHIEIQKETKKNNKYKSLYSHERKNSLK